MKLEVDGWEIELDEHAGRCELTSGDKRAWVDKDELHLSGYETFGVSTKAVGVAIGLLAGSGRRW